MKGLDSISQRPVTAMAKMKSCCTEEATSRRPAESVSAAPAKRRSRHQARQE